MNFEINLSLRRKKYIERRNIVRKFFFFLLFLLLILLMYFVLHLPASKRAKVEITKNYLIKSDYLLSLIDNEIANKNFFLLSPRAISQNLLLKCPLLSEAFLRKYLYPEYRFVVIVKENSIWGKIVLGNNLNDFIFVANNGKVIQPSWINLGLIPENLTLITTNYKNSLTQKTLNLLKDVLDYFNNNLDVKIEKFLITNKNTLEIYTENSIKIDAGYIDNKMLEKIQKLRDIFSEIKKKSYLIKYIDLSLENGAVIKKSDDEQIKKKHLHLFMLLH